MLSKLEKIQRIADKFAYRFLCTVISEEDLDDFHLHVELADLYYMDVITYMYKYKTDWHDGHWVLTSPTGGKILC